jgi:di/tricarboxylate transporter
MAALMACVALGLVPASEAFNGFGHPAVITVGAVLILSRAFSTSGALTTIAATLSAFMNDVGTLAILLPVAFQSAARAKRSPSTLLMPMSFGFILGGLVTLIGTSPNVIFASFRGLVEGTPFGFF